MRFKADSDPVSKDLVIRMPQNDSDQTSRIRTEASAFLKAGASPGSECVHHVQEEGWMLAPYIDEHVLSVRGHAHRNINKGSVSSSGYLFKKLYQVRDSEAQWLAVNADLFGSHCLRDFKTLGGRTVGCGPHPPSCLPE